MPGRVGEQHVGVEEFLCSRERGELKFPSALALVLGYFGRDRVPADAGEPQQQELAVVYLRPSALCEVEHLLHVPCVGHVVARSRRRHGTSVTPI